MLIEILHDLLKVLLAVNGGCILFAWLAAAREQTLIVWDWMEEPNWRRWSSGNVFSASLPEKYHVRRRRLLVLIFAFFAMLALELALMWLYRLTDPSASC